MQSDQYEGAQLRRYQDSCGKFMNQMRKIASQCRTKEDIHAYMDALARSISTAFMIVHPDCGFEAGNDSDCDFANYISQIGLSAMENALLDVLELRKSGAKMPWEGQDSGQQGSSDIDSGDKAV